MQQGIERRTYRVRAGLWDYITLINICQARHRGMWTRGHHVYDNFLFERSEFQIDTPHKKNLRVCPRARVK